MPLRFRTPMPPRQAWLTLPETPATSSAPESSESSPFQVEVLWSARARRLTLRLDPRDGHLRATVPLDTPELAVRRFLARQAGWMAARRRRQPQPVPFVPGAVVPLRGVEHVIRHQPDARRGVHAEPGILTIGGPAAFLARRLLTWLKAEARAALTPRVAAACARLGVATPAIAVRDPGTRWGSCSVRSGLSFSWRLILAPEWVLDYVVAHEVAHLREMNHSPRFWAVCAQLTDDINAPRAWLKTHGARLHRYGHSQCQDRIPSASPCC